MRGGSIIDVSQGVTPGVAPSPARRALDVVFGAAALLLLSPMILVVALAIKLTSSGPVLFRQVRVGHGRPRRSPMLQVPHHARPAPAGPR